MSRSSLSLWTEGLRHVVSHPLRSALTALTCAVAIAVTVNVISLNYGLDEDIRHDIQRFGRLTIDVGRSPLIRPGAPRAKFADEDLAKIRTLTEGLGAVVVPLRTESISAAGDEKVGQVVLAAVSPDYPKTLSIGLVAGAWFKEEDRGFSVCVLDKSAARELFPTLPPAAVLGKRVHLGGGQNPAGQGGREPRVVGILDDPMTYRALFDVFDEGRTTRTLVGSLMSFRNVYVPADALATADLTLVHVVLPDEERLLEAEKKLETVWPAASLEITADQVSPLTVFVRRTWMDAFGSATQMGAFAGNIVWILVCLVACVMISTLHLITIRERYDELAIRRCEGARKSDVVGQVTAECLMTSLVGGLLGLPLGYLGAAILRRIVDFPFRFDPRYAAGAIVVAAALGLVSSVVPARRAASLDPAAVLTRRLT